MMFDEKEYFNNFNTLAAHKKLARLAEEAIDLSNLGLITPERIERLCCKGGGYRLLFFAQKVDEQVLDALQELSDQAKLTEQFKLMRKGAVLNQISGFASENRQVLHCSSRDVFSDSPCHPESTAQAKTELNKLHSFLEQLDTGKILTPKGENFTGMIQVGIGGSDLGPRALYLALKAYARKDRQVNFISNVDPDDAAGVLSGLDLSRTLVNVVSKSGSTLETLANEELVRKAYTAAGLNPADYFLAVTGKDSPMDNPDNYLRSFYMFDYIGGRYSATSMVGMLMLGFALGFEQAEAILKGANLMDECATNPDIKKNPALMLALLGIWNHNFLGYHSLAVLPYSQALIRFAAHLQQLDMESNGKGINRLGEPLPYHSGPLVWGEPGTNGQHAFYQLLHQGTQIIPCEFIGFIKSQYQQDCLVKDSSAQEKLLANLLAQSLALATGQDHQNPNKRFPGNRPSSILLAERLDPASMGALLALYEAKTAFQGFAWNINSFDQEGVQLGKLLAERLLLHSIAANRKETPPDDPLAKALLNTLTM